MNVNLNVKYLTRNISQAAGGYVLQDDGEGVYIKHWFEPLLGPQPTDADLLAAEVDADAWGAPSGYITYFDFWELLSLPLQVAVSNEAERLRALPTPDTELKVLIGKTYDKTNEINLSDSTVTGTGGYFETILGKLVVNGVLTPAQAGAWGSLQEVS